MAAARTSASLRLRHRYVKAVSSGRQDERIKTQRCFGSRGPAALPKHVTTPWCFGSAAGPLLPKHRTPESRRLVLRQRRRASATEASYSRVETIGASAAPPGLCYRSIVLPSRDDRCFGSAAGPLLPKHRTPESRRSVLRQRRRASATEASYSRVETIGASAAPPGLCYRSIVLPSRDDWCFGSAAGPLLPKHRTPESRRLVLRQRRRASATEASYSRVETIRCVRPASVRTHLANI